MVLALSGARYAGVELFPGSACSGRGFASSGFREGAWGAPAISRYDPVGFLCGK